MNLRNEVVKKLTEKYKPISQIERINAVLNWDLNVNLPPEASKERAEQIAFLTKLSTKRWNNPQFKSLLDQASKEENLTKEEQAIIRNLNHTADFYYKVPEELIIEKAKVSSEAFSLWVKAKSENKFKSFSPILKTIISINRQIAEYLGYEENPYDALLDRFEPKLTSQFAQTKFNTVKGKIIPLIKQIRSVKRKEQESSFNNGERFYPTKKQQQLVQFIVRRMGYNLSSGRIDLSAHPFTTTLGRNDIRITTMYKQTDFRDSISSIMHECGHALYEQNINPDFTNTPLEGGVSFGIHEALSRFWENQIGKSQSFLSYLTPVIESLYPQEFSGVTSEKMVKLFNQVKPGFIRIEADELTYTLHIILRFEIENDLINQRISVENLPEVWREKMKTLLGVVPQTDTEGVLQDVHWAYGEFGYFPAYALGNLYASQILAAMKKDFPVDDNLENGNLENILNWLNKNIHQYGSLYWPEQLIKKATGEYLQAEYFIDYVSDKYNKLYSLK